MYCGGWRAGQRSGRGIQTNADGSNMHCGIWKNDEPFDNTERSLTRCNISSSASHSPISNSSEGGRHYQHQSVDLNTSAEDIVFLESELVAVADDSLMGTGRKTSSRRINPIAAAKHDVHDLPTHSKSMAMSPRLETIPASPPSAAEIPSSSSPSLLFLQPPSRQQSKDLLDVSVIVDERSVSSMGSFDSDDILPNMLMDGTERVSL